MTRESQAQASPLPNVAQLLDSILPLPLLQFLVPHRDKLFPAFGFGAQVPPDWQVSSLLPSPYSLFGIRILSPESGKCIYHLAPSFKERYRDLSILTSVYTTSSGLTAPVGILAYIRMPMV